MAIHRLGPLGGIVARSTLRSRPGGLGDGWQNLFFLHHEMESFFVVSDNQPCKGMVHGDTTIYHLLISQKMVEMGMVSYSDGNSRVLKWSYLLVLYHISGHMNWGYIPWNLGRFLRWPGIIIGGIMVTIGDMLNDNIGKNGGCIMIIVLIWEYLE